MPVVSSAPVPSPAAWQSCYIQCLNPTQGYLSEKQLEIGAGWISLSKAKPAVVLAEFSLSFSFGVVSCLSSQANLSKTEQLFCPFE